MIGALGEIELDALFDSGLRVACGVTVVLGASLLLVMLSRRPAVRHRLAGLGILATAAYLILGLLPLPRWDLSLWPERAASAAAASDGARADLVIPDASEDRELSRMPAAARVAEDPTTAPGASRDLGLTDQPAPVAGPVAEPVPAGTAGAARDLPSWSSREWIVAVFVLGACIQVLWLLLGLQRLRRVLASSRPASVALLRAASVPEEVAVRIAPDSVRPFCCGVIRATVVLPAHLALPTETSLAVLRHELAHARQGDPRLLSLVAVLQLMLFWNPLLWLLVRQRRFASELLADDAAAAGEVPAYVASMLALAERESVPTSSLAASVFCRKSEFFRRLEMLLSRKSPLSRSQSRASCLLQSLVAAMLVATSAGFFGATHASAQNPGQTQPAEQRQARASIDELRSTIAGLQAQIAEMQDKLARQRVRSVYGGFPGAGVGSSAGPKAEPNSLYRVREGDTLAKIANKVYGSTKSAKELQRLNPELQPDRLRVGQHIRIKAPSDPAGAADQALDDYTAAKAFQAAELGIRSAAPTANHSGQRLGELADLATRVIDLRGKVRVKELLISARVPSLELDVAKIELETLKQQVTAIEGLLRSEYKRLRQDLGRTQMLRKQGYVTEDEVSRLKQRIDFLKKLL